jgi:hypothetical protein
MKEGRGYLYPQLKKSRCSTQTVGLSDMVSDTPTVKREETEKQSSEYPT